MVLDMIDIKYESLTDVESFLEKTTVVAETSGLAKNGFHPFQCKINLFGSINIDIQTPEQTIHLKDFLPKKLNLRHVKNLGPNMVTFRQWNLENGHLDKMWVELDGRWFQKAGLKGIISLAHEIGHCLSGEKGQIVVTQEENQQVPIGQLPKAPNDPKEFPSYIENCCKIVNDFLKDEVEASNYGKAIALLFGVDETHIENLNEYSISAHVGRIFLEFKNGVDECIQRFGQNIRLEEIQQCIIYDISTQEEKELSYLDLVNFLRTYSQKDIERKEKDMQAMIGANKK